jgi:thiol-disulfide isomerase/thioredoxin
MFLRLFFRSPRSAVSGSSTAPRFVALPFLLLVALALSAAQQGAVDLSGRTVNPLQSSSGKVVVLIFVRRDCPISGRYAPTIEWLSSEHQSDTHFYLVFPDKSDSPAEIRKYLSDFRYSIPAVRDPGHVLVKLAHAQFTPEAAVLDRKGALVYHGRIDDLYVSFGHARSAPTTHELQDAIAAALAGRDPSHSEVAGIGCYISDLE